MKNNHSISIRPAVAFATSTFKRRFGLFTAMLLTIFGAWVVVEIFVIASQRLGVVIWAAAHLLFLLFFAGLKVGFLQISLALYGGSEPTFADAFRYFALGPKFLVGQVIYLLLVLVGLVLLVVPGLYLGVRYSLFGFHLVANGTGLTHSFQQSALLSAGAMLKLLAILVALLVLNVLGASLLGLGLFVTVPLSALIMTAIYQQLGAS